MNEHDNPPRPGTRDEREWLAEVIRYALSDAMRARRDNRAIYVLGHLISQAQIDVREAMEMMTTLQTSDACNSAQFERAARVEE